MNHENELKKKVDVSGEDVHWNLNEDESYGGYLRLHKLLECQIPKTEHHDEMLFVVVHQVAELWMKLLLHELASALKCIRSDNLEPTFKMFSRISRAQLQLIQEWDLLSTLTPVDYAQFRKSLGPASGFQSYQYRVLEFLLGNKNAALAEVHRNNAPVYAKVKEALNSPGLYDETLRLLSRKGFVIPNEKLERDWSQPYESDEAVEAVWLEVYQNVNKHWELYALAEKLVDIEENFHHWRFRHMKTVERIIGYKRGTGGTSGVSYLTKALDLRFFPELWSVRTLI
jgi:tryptophan 2,3-dioxygenase